MKQISILLAIVLTTTLANAAPPDTATANTVIRDFSREIYVMAERDGGSTAQWRAAQSKALAALRDVGDAHPETLIAADGKGRSPLMNAAIEGYHFMAVALLAYDTVRATIDATDGRNLTAYAHSQLALKRTLFACHPVIENPFVLVPIIVTQPYYDAHPPYASVSKLLLEAGADGDLTAARMIWLTNCKDAPQNTRDRVENSAGLQDTLFVIAKEVNTANRLREIDELAALMRKTIEPLIANGTTTQAELDQAIANAYTKGGFVPPTTE